MKKLLLSFLLCSAFGANAQVTVFEDSFEDYTDFAITGFGNWITLDLDGSETYAGGQADGVEWDNQFQPQAFQIFNPTAAPVSNATDGVNGSEESRNFDPRTGLKYAASWAAVMPGDGEGGSGSGPNNDWLISPVINLTGATGASLSVWVKSMSNTYGLEKYKIGVYTGTGIPTGSSDFTIISGGASLTAPYGNWLERTQSLAAYQGSSIRIGIQCVSSNAYMFMVDDFKVTAATMSVKDVVSSKFSVSPNPASNLVEITNGENILVSDIKITDLNGRIVKQLSHNSIENARINVSDLSAGMYMMTINSEAGTATKKIVKK